MTVEVNVQKVAITATADLSSSDLTNAGVLHKAITVNGAIAAGPHLALGLLKSKGNIGESIAVAVAGVMKGYAGAAITTIGFPVTVTTSGYIIACPSGSYAVGKAMEAASSGDLRPFFMDFANLSYFIN